MSDQPPPEYPQGHDVDVPVLLYDRCLGVALDSHQEHLEASLRQLRL